MTESIAKSEKTKKELPKKEITPEENIRIDELNQDAMKALEAYWAAFSRFYELSSVRLPQKSRPEIKRVIYDLEKQSDVHETKANALAVLTNKAPNSSK